MDAPELVRFALLAVGAVVVAGGVGIGVYLFGSFLLMKFHSSPRRFDAEARSLFREGFLATLTQPLLPLYYLFGRKMGAGTGVPIVFVHGYMHNRVGFLGLARALSRRGRGPIYGFNYPWFADIVSNAIRLERFVEGVCVETGQPKVDLVCHSMGGLVAMEMMRDEAKREKLKVRRCVTIATPHAGVVWRGPIFGIGGANLRRGSKLLVAHASSKVAVPCLSVYSSHDNIVYPKETSSLGARGGRDIEVEGPGHLSMLFSPLVADHVARFLDEPESAPANPV